MALLPPKFINSLILDAGPIIKNEPSVSTLLSQAECLFTVPAVIDEIRDVVARSRVETTLLPFLTVRTPRPASVKIISEFARRSGDLEVLSAPDLQILALAYELECEQNHGDWRLRKTPGQKRLNGAPPKSLDSKTNNDHPENISIDSSPPTLSSEEQKDAKTAEETTITPPSSTPSSTTVGVDNGMSEVQETKDDSLDDDERQDMNSNAELSDEGWITPSNIKEKQANDGDNLTESSTEPQVMQVVTMTTDFAMQNVLLRMNLNLISPTLQRIKQLKTWVLRCHACFNITKDMSKQFCSRCGKPTLLRTSCSTDKDGNFTVHLKKSMQWNTRGNVYSIPKPVAGTANGKNIVGGGKGGWGQSLILAEDQKEYVKAMDGARRKKDKDLMDDDFLPSILSGDRGRNGGGPKVGGGKNINSRRRR